MAIIYSYPRSLNILDSDILLGTTTVLVGGKPKNQTKSFRMSDISDFVSNNYTIPTLQQVTESGATTTIPIAIDLPLLSASDIISFKKNGVTQAYVTNNGAVVSNRLIVGTTDLSGTDLLKVNGSGFFENAVGIREGALYLYDDFSGTYTSLFSGLVGFSVTRSNSGFYFGISDSGEFVTNASSRATSFIKTGGLSTEYLLADGSVTTGPSLAGYVPTSRTISTTSPLQGGGDLTTNRTLSILQSTSIQDGYLSSTDWNTFNNKQNALNGTGFVKISGTTISYDNSTYVTTNTTQTITGIKVFNDFRLQLAAAGTSQPTVFQNSSGISTGSGGYNTIGFNSNSDLFFNDGGVNSAILSFSNTTTRTYTLPDTSGTLALTSQIPTVSGTTNYIPKFTGASALGDSLIFDNGTSVAIGTTATTSKLRIIGDTQTGASAIGILDLSQTWNTTGTPSALLLNVTDTASNSNSLLLNLQVNNNSLFRFQKNGMFSLNGVGSQLSIYGQQNGSLNTGLASGFAFRSSLNTNIQGPDFEFINGQGSSAITTGSGISMRITRGFEPTSGTATYATLELRQTINQTGGANGITRGIYINPTLTSAFDFRAIESTNGKVILTDTTTAVGGANAGSLLDLRQTWNTTGAPSAINLNVTDTASNANSTFADFGVNNISIIKFLKNGGIVPQSSSAVGHIFGLTSFTAFQGRSVTLSGIVGGNLGNFTNNYSYSSTSLTSGEFSFSSFNNSYTSTAGGTGITNIVSIQPTINQTGGGTGATRGLYINPTLTSAADFRAIELNNNTGFGILQSGTAKNSLAGSLNLGTTVEVSSAKLQVSSTTQGFLPPRMTNAQRLAITSPAVGLMVYCTDAVEGLYINKSTGWTFIA